MKGAINQPLFTWATCAACSACKDPLRSVAVNLSS